MKHGMFALVGSMFAAMLIVAPGGGFAQEATPLAGAETLGPVVTNPFFPLASVRYKEYVGEETDPDTGETIQTRVEETVLAETAEVAGVEVAVVEVKEYENGKLVESTLDYYAQDDDGTIYYLGESVDDYEDGEVVGHSGAWLAGEGENQPGLFMLPDPDVGQVFEQERAPGIAEDISTVIAVDEAITTPAGQFSGCLKTEDVNPLDDETENKYYCPGVGVVREESEDSFLDLVHFEGGPATTPTASS
ncbi:MAG: hypothetical protein ACRDJW_03500 [Thermomicrobiales bacterium]